MESTSTSPVNFRSLLSMPTDTAERPKPLPDCWLAATITNHEFGQSRRLQTPYVRFFFQPKALAASPSGELVDESSLDGIDLSRRQLRREFYITPDAIYRLGDFLDAVLGRETGRSYNERIPETRSADVLIHVTQRPSEDGSAIFNDVNEVVAA